MKIKTSELIGAVDLTDTVCKALRRAWQLGQTYWQQADSESFAQNKKAETTHAAFVALLDDTRAALASAAAPAEQPNTAYSELPKGDSAAPQLRAMATNYPAGHLWDKLDAKACIRGALEIEALRASHGQAPAQPATADLAGPSKAITASIMRDDGGDHPAFYLMVAYRSQADAEAALELLAAAPMSPANRLVACSAATRLRERGFEWDATAEAWLQPAPQQSGVGNSGFDHKTAADFLAGKTVSDEAARKFGASSRWAHDDRAGLQAKLLAAREAEIALLKTELMDAEAAAKQGGAA